jgi:hypothetical protein
MKMFHEQSTTWLVTSLRNRTVFVSRDCSFVFTITWRHQTLKSSSKSSEFLWTKMCMARGDKCQWSSCFIDFLGGSGKRHAVWNGEKNNCLPFVFILLTTGGALCHGHCLALSPSHCVDVPNCRCHWCLNPWQEILVSCLPVVLWSYIEDWYSQPGMWPLMW